MRKAHASAERLIVILRVTMIVILWMTMVRKIKEGLQSVYLRLHDCLETMQRKEALDQALFFSRFMIVILWMTMVRKIKEGLQSSAVCLHACCCFYYVKTKEEKIPRLKPW